jgi:hypothetical protein
MRPRRMWAVVSKDGELVRCRFTREQASEYMTGTDRIVQVLVTEVRRKKR